MQKPILATVAAGLFALAAPLSSPAQQQAQNSPGQQDQQSGEARVIERQGPKVELKPGQRPLAAVVFTQASSSPGQAAAQAGSNDLSISILQTDSADASKDREALFEQRNAEQGFVTHDFGQQQAQAAPAQGQQAAKSMLIITARRGGEVLPVEQMGGSGQSVMMFAVKHQEPSAVAGAGGQNANQQAKPGEAQPAGARQAPDQSKPAQPSAAQQQQQQQAQQQAQQKQQQQQQKPGDLAAEPNDAVIFIYLVGGPQQQH